MAFLRMPDFFSDLLGWLTRPGYGPRLVHGNGYRRDRSTIHASKTYQLAVRIGHRHDDSFLHLRSLFNDEIDHALCLGVVNRWNGSHGWKLSRGCQKRRNRNRSVEAICTGADSPPQRNKNVRAG